MREIGQPELRDDIGEIDGAPRPRSSKLAEMIATGRARAPLTYRRGAPEPVPFEGTDEQLDQLVRDSR
jgi:hypothetical protein